VDIGKTMHLTTVAERIKTEDQLRELQDLDCPLGQGYLFSRPSQQTRSTRSSLTATATHTTHARKSRRHPPCNHASPRQPGAVGVDATSAGQTVAPARKRSRPAPRALPWRTWTRQRSLSRSVVVPAVASSNLVAHLSGKHTDDRCSAASAFGEGTAGREEDDAARTHAGSRAIRYGERRCSRQSLTSRFRARARCRNDRTRIVA
jgi:hypothetical protein